MHGRNDVCTSQTGYTIAPLAPGAHSHGYARDASYSYVYLHYQLARPVICTLNFRSFVTQKDPRVKLVPLKTGEGYKYTQEGVIKAPFGFVPHEGISFKKIGIKYTSVNKACFQEVSSKTRIKIFFKGFSTQVSEKKILSFFSQFGELEYLYIMSPPKDLNYFRSLQGYIIFTENKYVARLFSQKNKLFFDGLKILCEIYQTRKSRKHRSLTSTDAPVNKPTTDSKYFDSQGEKPSNLVKDSKSMFVGSKNARINEVSYCAPLGQTHSDHSNLFSQNFRTCISNRALLQQTTKEDNNFRFNMLIKSSTRQLTE